jgi:hypothetical protein
MTKTTTTTVTKPQTIIITTHLYNYGTAAEFRSKIYRNLVLQYESTGLGVPSELVRAIIIDALESVATAAFIEWLQSLGLLLKQASIAFEFKSLVDDANKIKELLTKSSQYSLHTQLLLSDFDYESYPAYGVKSPQKDYPQEFISYLKTNFAFAGTSLYDLRIFYGGHPDAVTIQLAYMSWLAQNEANAWKLGNVNDALKYVAMENSFLKEHLSVWLPKFKDESLTATPPAQHLVLDLSSPSDSNYYNLISRINDFVQDDLKYVQKLNSAQEILTSFSSDQIAQGQTKSFLAKVLEGISRLIIRILWGGSELDLVVVDPTGKEYSASSISPNEKAVIVDNPIAGIWTIKVYGKNIPSETESYIVALSISNQVLPPSPSQTLTTQLSPTTTQIIYTATTITTPISTYVSTADSNIVLAFLAFLLIAVLAVVGVLLIALRTAGRVRRRPKVVRVRT